MGKKLAFVISEWNWGKKRKCDQLSDDNAYILWASLSTYCFLPLAIELLLKKDRFYHMALPLYIIRLNKVQHCHILLSAIYGSRTSYLHRTVPKVKCIWSIDLLQSSILCQLVHSSVQSPSILNPTRYPFKALIFNRAIYIRCRRPFQ
jgi:hypothetical protein